MNNFSEVPYDVIIPKNTFTAEEIGYVEYSMKDYQTAQEDFHKILEGKESIDKDKMIAIIDKLLSEEIKHQEYLKLF